MLLWCISQVPIVLSEHQRQTFAQPYLLILEAVKKGTVRARKLYMFIEHESIKKHYTSHHFLGSMDGKWTNFNGYI